MGDQLSPEDMVSMFCSVTHLSEDQAREHLEAFNWSLEAAVNNALTVSALDDTGVAAQDTPPARGAADSAAEPSSSGGEIPRAPQRHAAPLPRGPRPVSPFRRFLGRVYSIMGPFLLPLVRAIVGGVGFVAQILLITPFRMLLGGGVLGPRGGPGVGVGPRDREALNAIGAADAARFRDSFEEDHGKEHAPFFIGSLQQAIDAAKVSGPAPRGAAGRDGAASTCHQAVAAWLTTVSP